MKPARSARTLTSVALSLKHPEGIATAAALIATPPPLASGFDNRTALDAWGIPGVDVLLASGGAVSA